MNRLGRVVVALVNPLTGLAAIGFATIAASGLLAGVLATMAGTAFVSGDIPWVTYTAERCQELHALVPTAASCAAAAAAHHLDEITFEYPVMAVLLGVVSAAVWSQTRALASRSILPPLFTETVAVTAFGLSGAIFALQTVQRLTFGGGAGAGVFLAQALVSLLVAVVFVVRFLRQLESGAQD